MPEEIGLGFKYSKMPDGRPLIILDGDTFGAFVAMLENGTFSAVQGSADRFDPLKTTVGDLVDKNVNDPRMQIDASTRSDLSSRPLGLVQAMVSSKPFDPMRPTVGDLVGIKAVDVAASAPPVVRRIDGRFDPLQVTVGDLVQGHTSGKGPLAGRQKCERPRSPFLTF